MDMARTVQGDKTAKWFIVAEWLSLLLQKSSYSNASTSFFNAISCGVGVVYSTKPLSTLPERGPSLVTSVFRRLADWEFSPEPYLFRVPVTLFRLLDWGPDLLNAIVNKARACLDHLIRQMPSPCCRFPRWTNR